MADKKSNVDQEKLLEAGKAAKVRLYQTLLRKIADGIPLKTGELKTFRSLEDEFESQLQTEQAEKGKRKSFPKKIRTFGAAAEYCGVSKRTISYHVGRGNIRQNKDGSFSRDELDRYLEKRGRKISKASGQGPDEERAVTARREMDEKDAADLRWRLARAQREEVLTKQLLGELISREEVAKGWADRVGVVVSGLNALIDRLPPILEGKSRAEMRELIKAEVYELRRAYCEAGEYSPKVN